MQFRIDSLTFSGGETVHVPPGAIVLVVGPNNAGKSTCLTDVLSQCLTPGRPPVGRVVAASALDVKVDFDEFVARYGDYVQVVANSPISLGGQVIDKAAFPAMIGGGHHHGTAVRARMVQRREAHELLQLVHPASMWDRTTAPPTAPGQVLWENEVLAGKVSSYFRRAFGVGVTVNRNAGTSIPLHLGDAPDATDCAPHSREMLQKYNALPRVEVQGSGMRSFLGCLLEVLVENRCILLLDEPEAFLHPPQARLLGEFLAREKPDDLQLVIATHDAHLVKGLLNAKSDRLVIVRIERRGSKNHARSLSAEDVATLWEDPILRFSNVIDGVFHERVVICEADTDCRFYDAMVTATTDAGPGLRRPDLLFVPSGGKHRVPKIMRALRALGVAADAIFDFDVLNDPSLLRTVVEAANGAWTDLERDWKIVSASIASRKQGRPQPSRRSAIRDILQAGSEEHLAKQEIDAIEAELHPPSAWRDAKELGIRAVAAGEAHRACEQLLASLRTLGIFVVPSGELESFDRSSGSKPGWLPAVLQKDLAVATELESARAFVSQLAWPASTPARAS